MSLFEIVQAFGHYNMHLFGALVAAIWFLHKIDRRSTVVETIVGHLEGESVKHGERLCAHDERLDNHGERITRAETTLSLWDKYRNEQR